MRISDWSSDVCSSVLGRRLYGQRRAEYQPGSGDGPKMFLQRRLGMVRHPGVRLGPEILDNHFLDMTIAAMQIADRHQRLDPFLSRLSNANQQAGRERHLCPARFLNGGEASGRSFIGPSEMRSSAFAQPR